MELDLQYKHKVMTVRKQKYLTYLSWTSMKHRRDSAKTGRLRHASVRTFR